MGAARVGIPLALAALELAHPADGRRDTWWLAIHLSLIAGYLLLVWTLWPAALLSRLVLSVFAASNTVYLVVEGVLFQTGPWVEALANATGAAWCGALLSIAAARTSSGWERAALALVWCTFVASSIVPVAALAARLLASASVAVVVYTKGARAVPLGLLIFAAVLRQHVGPEAALGILLIAVASGVAQRRCG